MLRLPTAAQVLTRHGDLCGEVGKTGGNLGGTANSAGLAICTSRPRLPFPWQPEGGGEWCTTDGHDGLSPRVVCTVLQRRLVVYEGTCTVGTAFGSTLLPGLQITWPLPVSAHQAIAGYISALGSEPKHVATWQREPRPTRYVFLPSKAWGPVPVADDATHAEIPLDLTNCPVWAPTAYSTFPQYSFVRKASNGTVSFRLCAPKRLVVVGGWGGYVAEFDGNSVVGCHNCMKKLFYDSWAVINHNQVYRSYHKSVGCSAIVRFGEPMEKRSGSRQGARGAKRTDNWLPERRRFIDARVKGAQTQHFSNFTYPSPNPGMSSSKVGPRRSSIRREEGLLDRQDVDGIRIEGPRSA
ncbi:hypothetical protein EDB85DRAFT_2278850 [Lactarius pseudohatsudake]|nr:hypothetical protein EDB85DRAFT_2278850 [Lactarius pseudohatsudake]